MAAATLHSQRSCAPNRLLVLAQAAELRGMCASREQQSQAAAQHAQREQKHLREQLSHLTAELATVSEDRYELQVGRDNIAGC